MRELFDAWLEFASQFGEADVIPKKTRIHIQARARFAGAVIGEDCVECRLWLKRFVRDARFQRVEKANGHYIYYFRLTDETQLDAKMKEYVREAFQAGRRVK